MKLKISKKLLFFILAILFLLLAIITIRTTYARYVTSLAAEGSVELGSWLINVNNQNIIETSNISNWVFPIMTDEVAEYTADGKLAPGSSGYVELTLDYSKVTVPFMYDVSFSTASDSPLEDLILTSYEVAEGDQEYGEEITLENPTDSILDTISPDDTIRTRKLKLNFTWFEGADEILDDAADAAYTVSNESVGMRFDLKFTQLQPLGSD